MSFIKCSSFVHFSIEYTAWNSCVWVSVALVEEFEL